MTIVHPTAKTETRLQVVSIATSDKPDWLFQDADYIKEDTLRLQEWKDDVFHLCGIRVRIVIHNWTTGNRVEYQSAGIWGIESDAPHSQFIESARDELHNLQAEYPQFANLQIPDDAAIVYESI